MTEYAFTVPLVAKPPTANSRMHWAPKAKLTAQIRETAGMVALAKRRELGVQPCPRMRRKVRLTRILGKGERFLDPGANLGSHMKAIVDSLVDSGWLHGDSAALIELTEAQDGSQRHRGPCVDVVVEV